MAKRLTDTDKWNDDWFISLDNDYRIIWQWLLDNCNHAGICKRSMKLLNMMCNTKISELEMVEKMEGRIITVDNNWFIPKFLKFQYTGLHSNKPVIVSVVNELEKYNYTSLIPESFGNDYLIIKDKDKRKDMDKDKSKEKIKENGVFENKKGVSFNDDFTRVYFDDDSWQELGQEQKILAEGGDIKPYTIIKGSIY